VSVTKQVPQTYNLSASDLRLEAAPAAELKVAGELRRFSMVAYSGGLAHEYYDPTVIDLAGLKVPASVPALRQHDHTRFVGRIDASENDGESLKLTGFLFDNVSEAAEVAAIADQGGEWQASVGVRWEDDDSDLEWVEEGRSESINGRELAGPFLWIKHSTLRECSFVPLGADPNTSAVTLAALRDVCFSSTKEAPVATKPETDPLTVERARMSAIRKEFAADPDFALACIDEGLSPVEAKAKYADKLAAELAAKDEAHKAELEALKAEHASKPAAPAAALSQGTFTHTVSTVELSDDPVERWEQEIDLETKRLRDAGHRGFTRGLNFDADYALRQQASINIRKNNPELTAAFVKAFNQQTTRKAK